MSEGRNERARVPGAVDHEVRRVARLPDGGFVLQAGERSHRVVAAEGGWVVESDDDLDGWSLRRAQGSGFVLQRTDAGVEVARTMPLVGAGCESSLRFLLLEDGRLFRIALRGPRDGHFELTGWEIPGAYLEARPEGEGWRLEPTCASGGLSEIRVLCLMLATEALDAEGALRTREP